MHVQQALVEPKRFTTADEVFHRLKTDIISMRLAPGTKLSEVEMAKLYDVSRQPVREAFLRLGSLNLLQIRPQKATRVRKISNRDLANTRFIRAAVEVEVVRMACSIASKNDLEAIDSNLALQKIAIDASDAVALKKLDYEFHRLICIAANCLPAFETIAENKAHTDRACTLELANDKGMAEVLEGHTNIINAIKLGDEETAVKMTRIHLAHLDSTLDEARKKHPDYFED